MATSGSHASGQTSIVAAPSVLAASSVPATRARIFSRAVCAAVDVSSPNGANPQQLALAISYSESGADGRIRTGDPLFTNQAAIEFQLEILAFHVFVTRPLSAVSSIGLATELATVNRAKIRRLRPLAL